jgi:outer membrane immunogenic protein
MRRLVRLLPTSAVSVVAIAVASIALAADIPRKAPVAPAYFNPAPAYTWSGFYAGANLGWGWARASLTVAGATGTSNFDGVLGGVQAGYNYQLFGPLVVGVEADIQLTDQRRSVTFGPVTVTERIPYFGTLRGRVGYAWDNWLLYGTGGAVYGEHRITATAGGATASLVDSGWGWTAGGGVEVMFWQRFSGKLEYLYAEANKGGTVLGVPYTARLVDHIVRAGVNYHF